MSLGIWLRCCSAAADAAAAAAAAAAVFAAAPPSLPEPTASDSGKVSAAATPIQTHPQAAPNSCTPR